MTPVPEPAHLRKVVPLRKEEAFEICDALAAGESVLAGHGFTREAKRLALAFELAESALVR